MQSSTRRSCLFSAYRRLAWFLPALALLSPTALDAQEDVRETLPPALASNQCPAAPNLMMPADVLTPNARRNTPYLKVAVRVGGNYSSYSNDRYLDNTLLDVGRTSGETAIYSRTGGFAYGGGAELEYPLNTALSLIGSVDFQQVHLLGQGPVTEECIDSGSPARSVATDHRFEVDLRYVRLGGALKITMSNYYIVGGLTAAPLLSSNVLRERRIVDGGATCLLRGDRPAREVIEEDVLPDPAALHYSLRLGFGRTYQLGERFQFSPELLVDFGFNAINKSPESDLDIYGLSAVLRYEIR
jgi:hypothetical protein